MKTLHTISGLSVVTLVVAAAEGGMNGLSYDIIGHDLVAGGANTTIQLFAELDQNNRLDAVFGNGDFDLRLEYQNGASAYQNQFGGATSQSINPADFASHPSLQWDSFVTIGATNVTGDPFATNTLQSVGVDWTSWENGGDLYSDTGTWFITPLDAQGVGQDGRVLIAQLTIFHGGSDHIATFWGGFQGYDTPDWQGNIWQWGLDPAGEGFKIVIPGPPALAAIMLSGIWMPGRRRRNGADRA